MNELENQMGSLNINKEGVSEYQKNKNRNQNSYQYNQVNQTTGKENIAQGFEDVNYSSNKMQQQKSYKDYLDSQVKEKGLNSMKSSNLEKPVTDRQNQPIIGDSRPARFLKKPEILSSNPCKKN